MKFNNKNRLLPWAQAEKLALETTSPSLAGWMASALTDNNPEYRQLCYQEHLPSSLQIIVGLVLDSASNQDAVAQLTDLINTLSAARHSLLEISHLRQD